LVENKTTLAFTLLIAGLILGGSVGYYSAQQRSQQKWQESIIIDTGDPSIPLKNAVVKLGYIAPDASTLAVGKPFHEQIIAADLNSYANILGYGTTFTYLIDDANGQDSIHLEKVQGLQSFGVTILEGGGWSSQAQSALSYCNANGMLMWSASSTSPTLAIANDNLFRMCASDGHLAPALVNIMWAFGVKSIVIFQRGDSWGDGVVNLLVPLWTAKGGAIEGNRTRYPVETADFSGYLKVADQQVATAVARNIGASEMVGVVMLAQDEVSVILKQSSAYSNIYNVHWWGGEGAAKNQKVMDEAPNEANHIGFYSLLPSPQFTLLYNSLQNRYEALTKQQFSSTQAYSYDISLVVSNSIYQTQSTSGAVLVPLQKPTSDRTFGSAGYCGLDEFGDRLGSSYDIWRYEPSATKESVSNQVGLYDPVAEGIKTGTGTVIFPEVIGPRPPGP